MLSGSPETSAKESLNRPFTFFVVHCFQSGANHSCWYTRLECFWQALSLNSWHPVSASDYEYLRLLALSEVVSPLVPPRAALISIWLFIWVPTPLVGLLFSAIRISWPRPIFGLTVCQVHDDHIILFDSKTVQCMIWNTRKSLYISAGQARILGQRISHSSALRSSRDYHYDFSRPSQSNSGTTRELGKPIVLSYDRH